MKSLGTHVFKSSFNIFRFMCDLMSHLCHSWQSNNNYTVVLLSYHHHQVVSSIEYIEPQI